MLAGMQRMRSFGRVVVGGVGGVLVASVLACGGDAASTTEGSSGGLTSTGETTTTGTPGSDTTAEPGASEPTTSPGTHTAPTTTHETSTTGTTGTSSTGDDTSSTTDVTSTSTGNSDTGSSSTGEPATSECDGADFAICEGFEGARDGGFPDSWGLRGDEWGEGIIGVASDDARRGLKALKVDGGNNGQHFMDYKGDLGDLAKHHFGRVFLKVAVPAPWPAMGVLHADFIEGKGPGPKGGTHNVRWGVVENAEAMQWIYNVQPSNGDPEFAEGTGYEYTWTGEWQCMEWFYDYDSQTGGLWIDGVDMGLVPGKKHPAEIPVFGSLGVGLANYQPAGEGFMVWFDELAYDPERIGCGD